MMEPWDGPAAIAFTDGRQIGATLDRNGLRPARYIVTDDDLVVMASEAGVLPNPRVADHQEVAAAARQDVPDRHRAGPHHRRQGAEGPARGEQAVPAVDRAHPHQARRDRGRRRGPRRTSREPDEPLLDRQQAFGYTQEDLKFLMAPMAITGEEAVGSMGNDTPLAVLSDQQQAAVQLLQAAVRAGHQPADRPDPRTAGDVAGVLHRAQAEPARHQQHQSADAARGRASRSSPPSDMAKIRNIEHYTHGKFRSFELDICYPVALGQGRRRGAARVALRARGRRDQAPATTS